MAEVFLMGNTEFSASKLGLCVDTYVEFAEQYVSSGYQLRLLSPLQRYYEVLCDLPFDDLPISIHGPWLEARTEIVKFHEYALHAQGAVTKMHIRNLMATRNNLVYSIAGTTGISRDGVTIPMSTGSKKPGMSSFSTRRTAAPAPSPFPTQAGVPPPSGPAVKFEMRYLTARAPAVVAVNTRFTLTARVDIMPGDGPSAPLAELAIPVAGLMVTVEAIVGARIKLQGPLSQQVLIMPGEASSEMEICLEAIEIGSTDIVLRARTDQAYIGDLRIGMMVANKGAPDTQELKSQVAAKPAQARVATLMVTYERAQRLYRFILLGPAQIGTHVSELVLDEDLDLLVPKLMAQANGLARGAVGYSAPAVEAILSGMGADMWKRLIPDKLKTLLAACWDQIDRLAIVSDDDPVPWELLFAFMPGGPQMGFISDKWLISRWRYGQGAPAGVGAGPSIYVVPSSAPQAANDEVDALRKIFPSKAIWKTVDDLTSGICRPGMGLLHIAAHNSMRYNDAASTSITLDKPFPQTMLGPQLQGVLEHRPLVFLNACASAAATVQWQGSTSWAARFLDAGAGAFVGSNWEVRDNTASAFAQEFYARARQEHTLGDAFQKARTQSGGPGDPTRFAYSFFGDPDAVLLTQRADDAI